VGFFLAIAILTLFVANLQVVGVSPFPVTTSRPEALRLDIDASVPAGGVLYADAVLAHGSVHGVALLLAIGLLLVSLPSSREMALVQLHSRFVSTPMRRLSMVLCTPVRILAGVGDSIETLFTIGQAPMFATVGMVPLAVGVVLAASIARIVF
jgi:hypothetical protein